MIASYIEARVSWCMFMGKCVNFIGIFSLPTIGRREKNVNIQHDSHKPLIVAKLKPCRLLRAIRHLPSDIPCTCEWIGGIGHLFFAKFTAEKVQNSMNMRTICERRSANWTKFTFHSLTHDDGSARSKAWEFSERIIRAIYKLFAQLSYTLSCHLLS